MLATTLLLLLAAQRHTAIVPNPDEPPPPPARSQPCRDRPDQITVCAQMSRERMAELEARYAEHPLRPDFTAPGGGTGTVHAVQRSTINGASAPAMMVTVTVPLGKKEKKDEDDK